MLDLTQFKNQHRTKSLADISETYNNKSAGYVDSRYWKLTTPDKKGGASSGAIIRFLPSHNPLKPFVTVYSYSFEGVGGKYIENSLQSIGLPDPVQEYNYKLYQTGDEAKRADTKKRNRKLHYVTNILVVKDPVHPENDGKVFLFKFGVKIYEKIIDAMNGDAVEERQPLNIFDFDSGANFSLNITFNGKSGFFEYDKSKFLSQSSIGDESEQMTILEQIYDLDTCTPIKYKSYQELSKRFNLVMQIQPSQPTLSPDGSDGDNGFSEQEQIPIPTPTPTGEPKAKVKVSLPTVYDTEFSEFDSLMDDMPF